MEMHSTLVIFILLFLAWNSAALPCDGTYDVGDITCPEEVILVTVSESDDDEDFENPAEPYPISTDDLDHSLGGEEVEAAANEGIGNIKSDPLTAIENAHQNQEDSRHSVSREEAAGEGLVSTESVNVEK